MFDTKKQPLLNGRCYFIKMEDDISSFTLSDINDSDKNTADALWHDTALKNITLVTCDNKHIKTHKIILL